ncbi:MAG: Crp/Fnr family transcriptional regulator [Halomonas sp.]|nr:Crp/Fnr family transcriptional regulator [Halomonas sp.]
MFGSDESLIESNGLPPAPASFQTALLDALDTPTIKVKKRHRLWNAGTSPSVLYMLQSGWAYTYQSSHGKALNVIDVFLPGDLAGVRDASLRRHSTDAAMLTDGVISVLDKAQLYDLFERAPSLARHLFIYAAHQQASLANRLTNVMGNDARCRIAHFILDIFYRLKKVQRGLGHRFPFPLLQKHISLALGLTHVHVSRLLKELEEQGVIRKTRQELEILDLKRLVEMANYPKEALSDGETGIALHVALASASPEAAGPQTGLSSTHAPAKRDSN